MAHSDALRKHVGTAFEALQWYSTLAVMVYEQHVRRSTAVNSQFNGAV